MIRILILLIAAQAALAAEGVILTQRTEDLRRGSKGSATIYLQPQRVAVISNDAGRSQTFVYLADQQLMRVIDHERKVYRELNEQDLEKIGSAMSQVREQMAERMKNMSPEQRAMMEKMMRGRLGQMQQPQGDTSASTTYTPAGGSAEIGGYSCEWYEARREGEVVAKICAAEWDAFEFDSDDFQVFRDMAEFVGKLAPGMADRIEFGGPEDAKDRYPGVPVEQTIYSGGQPTMKTVLEDYQRDEIDEETFAAPDNYQRQQGLGR